MANLTMKDELEELRLKEEELNKDGKQLEVGEKIKKIRYELGKSQKEFAEMIDVDLSTLKKYELNTSTFKIRILKNIVEHTEVSADYILGVKTSDNTEINIHEASLYTGLYANTLEYLHANANDYMYITIINLLFTCGFMQGLIDLIKSYYRYNKIYSIINHETALANSLKNTAEFVKWQELEFLTTQLTKTVDLLNKIVPDNVDNINEKVNSVINTEEYKEIEEILKSFMDIIDFNDSRNNDTEEVE